MVLVKEGRSARAAREEVVGAVRGMRSGPKG
jgi:hypothetical protein